MDPTQPRRFWKAVMQALMASPQFSPHTKLNVGCMLDRLADVPPTTKAVVHWLMAQGLKPETCLNYGSRVAANVRRAFPDHPLIHVSWHVRVALGLAVTDRLDTVRAKATADRAPEFTPRNVKNAWLATPPAIARRGIRA